MKRGEIWWADLPPPRGSEPGYSRPVLVIQSDWFNETGIATVLTATLTSNSRLGGMMGNVLLPKGTGGLPRTSIVNITQLSAVDRRCLRERIGSLPKNWMTRVDASLRLVLEL